MNDAFEIAMTEELLHLPSAPRDLAEVATVAINHLKEAIVFDRVPHLLLLTFRGPEVRTWVIRGALPAPVDDVVRGLVRQLGAEALALVYPMPVPREVQADRVMNLALERPEGSLDVLFAMTGAPELPGSTFQLHQRSQLENRWFGVESPWRVQICARVVAPLGGEVGEA